MGRAVPDTHRRHRGRHQRETFGADILIANRDPYGLGWLVRLEPDGWDPTAVGLITGPSAVEAYETRIDELGVSCFAASIERGRSEASMTETSHPIRLLDLAPVDPVRSQSIYHAVGYAMAAGSPDTIMLVSPDAPYVSIGRHQDVDREVDRAVCAELGFPIIRREIGGGAVYLDGNQLFTQWIFAAEHLPATVEERFALYCDTLVQTYRTLGIEAAYRPVNDIHVKRRKIGGTGAARMDRVEVVVGSLMFDFDIATMSRVLRGPCRSSATTSTRRSTSTSTTMVRGWAMPHRGAVYHAYLAACSAAWAADRARRAP